MTGTTVVLLRRRQDAGAAAVLAVLLAWSLMPGRAPSAVLVVSNRGWVLAPAYAGAQCLRAARRASRPDERTSWRLLGTATLIWATGSVLYGVEELLGDAPVRFPSLADLGYVVFALLVLAALVQGPDLRPSALPRLRLVLEGAVVASSLLVIAWLAGLGELDYSGDAAQAARLCFAIADVLAASVALLVLERSTGRHAGAAGRAAPAVLVVALGDLAYSTMASTSGYTTGGPLDVLWPAGFLLLANAAARPSRAEGPSRRRRSFGRLLAVAPAAVAGGALVASGRLVEGLGPALAGLVVALGGALVARQAVLAADNAALHRSLERRVVERTAQLQRAHAEAAVLAATDALTGLPNRDAFVGAAGAGHGELVGVVLLDVDGFQQINDSFGHDVGDRVLQWVAQRLRASLRAGEHIARLGGDEFALRVTGLQSAEDALSVARRALEMLGTPLPIDRLEIVPRASAGVAVGGPGMDVQTLLRDADTALHRAKAAGGGQVLAFRPEMHRAVRQSLALEADLRAALRGGELDVHYQPVVDLRTGRIAGFEALARWSSPVHGRVAPGDFVAAAERSGLVVELDRFVLDAAAAALARWRLTAPDLTMAVNVSPRSLREPDVIADVIGVLWRHGLPASALVLEVTESLLFDDVDHVRCVLAGLHAAGVGLALDDFGTGYSSLSRLASHPFDTLKIDRSFVLQLDGVTGAPVLTATLALARGLGVSVVAEGVETAEQLAFLRAHGCDLAQGYLLARPAPAADIEGLLSARLLPGGAAAPAPA